MEDRTKNTATNRTPDNTKQSTIIARGRMPGTPLYGAGVSPLPDPGPGGDRAPPRGVDVKPRGNRGPGRAQTPSGAPEGSKALSRALASPLGGALGAPETAKIPVLGISRTRPLPRGGFYINPSRRGPVPGFSRIPGNPQNTRIFPILAEKGQIWGIPGKLRKKAIFGHFSVFWGFWGIPGKPGTGPRREGLM